MSDSEALLGLCCSLHGLSSSQLQSKVNNYVSIISNINKTTALLFLQLCKWTEADTAFIIPIQHQDCDTLSIQVLSCFIQGLLLSNTSNILVFDPFPLVFVVKQIKLQNWLTLLLTFLVDWMFVWVPFIWTILLCFARLLAPPYWVWRKYR